MLSLQMITQARGRVAPVARCTPVLDIEIPGRRVALKLENLQRTGAFKIRGGTNCIALMDAEERARGVIAASAGNHAQGVAAAALAAARAEGLFTTTVCSVDDALPRAPRGAALLRAGDLAGAFRAGDLAATLVAGFFAGAAFLVAAGAFLAGAGAAFSFEGAVAARRFTAALLAGPLSRTGFSPQISSRL